MNQLMQNIEQTISKQYDSIGKNASNINFLDSLKYFLVDEIKNFEIPSYKEIGEQEFTKNFGNNDLLVKSNYYLDQLSKIKSSTPKDFLSIVVSGKKSIRI